MKNIEKYLQNHLHLTEHELSHHFKNIIFSENPNNFFMPWATNQMDIIVFFFKIKH